MLLDDTGAVEPVYRVMYLRDRVQRRRTLTLRMFAPQTRSSPAPSSAKFNKSSVMRHAPTYVMLSCRRDNASVGSEVIARTVSI